MRIEEIRTRFAARLRARRGEIEQAALTRVNAIADPDETSDPEYRDGLRRAVSVALDHGIEAIERSEDRPPPIPTLLLAQARLAARRGVKLETVLRRYLAGYALLGDFLIEECERDGLNGAGLKRLLRVQSALLDRLIAAVSEEYVREAKGKPHSGERRRLERVERLLAGEFVDPSELGYNLEGNHLGMIAFGPEAEGALRDLAGSLDRNLLLIRRGEGTVWGWLGGRRATRTEEAVRALGATWPARAHLVLGEPGRGLSGWQLTHKQARAALPVALRRPPGIVRYIDVSLLTSLLQDDVLAASLNQIYLAPLSDERNDGAVLRETLRAYFGAGRNVTSAASALGVSRQTIGNRLRIVEERLGRSLDESAVELELVLRMEQFLAQASQPDSFAFPLAIR